MVVSSLEQWFSSLWATTPWHLIAELVLFVLIIILIFRKPEPIKKDDDLLTPEEQEQLINEWVPQPLVPDNIPEDGDRTILHDHVVTSGPSDTIEVDGIKAINMAVPNYFGLNMNKEIIDASLAAIDRYAVGACGPRQFYGTMDAHLELEDTLAQWAESEESVGYCYPFATTTSVIQAFCHNTDVLFVDEGSWFAIRLGAELTRGKVYTYKHNDMADLRSVVEKVKKSFPRWAKINRWVVTEGLFQNDGSILDLPELMKVRHDFCLRTIIDETNSFGVLGATGKGVCEHFNVPRTEIEVSIGSFGTAFASLGGFTVGSHEISAHQRLSSHAYIFSASPPCFNAVAASTAIKIASRNGEEIISKQRENATYARRLLSRIPEIVVDGSDISPLIHIHLRKEYGYQKESELLEEICSKALLDSDHPTAITKSKYCNYRELNLPRPSIKVYVSPAHTKEQIEEAVSCVERTTKAVLQ